MKLKTVTYHVRAAIEDFCSDQIELTAELDDDDNCKDVAAILRATCIECLDEPTQKKEEYRRELERTIEDLLYSLKVAKDEWDKAQLFLVTQGLRENVPDFPISKRLIEKLQEAGGETF